MIDCNSHWELKKNKIYNLNKFACKSKGPLYCGTEMAMSNTEIIYN